MSMWTALHEAPGLHWLLGHAFWLPALLSLAVSPLGMIAVAAILERRWLHPSKQYVSFFWGDQALALAALLSGVVLSHAHHVAKVVDSVPWTLAVIVLALAAGLGGWAVDAHATHPHTGARIYTRGQLLSPTKIFHNAICYLPIGLVLGCVTIPALTASTDLDAISQRALQVTAGALVAMWAASALWWDARHIKPDAHIEWPRRSRSAS